MELPDKLSPEAIGKILADSHEDADNGMRILLDADYEFETIAQYFSSVEKYSRQMCAFYTKIGEETQPGKTVRESITEDRVRSIFREIVDSESTIIHSIVCQRRMQAH